MEKAIRRQKGWRRIVEGKLRNYLLKIVEVWWCNFATGYVVSRDFVLQAMQLIFRLSIGIDHCNLAKLHDKLSNIRGEIHYNLATSPLKVCDPSGHGARLRLIPSGLGHVLSWTLDQTLVILCLGSDRTLDLPFDYLAISYWSVLTLQLCLKRKYELSLDSQLSRMTQLLFYLHRTKLMDTAMTTHWSIDQPWASLQRRRLHRSRQLAWTVYKSCRDAPESFNNISVEVLSLHALLKEVEETISDHPLLNQNKQASRQSRPDVETCFKTVVNIGESKTSHSRLSHE